MLARVLPIVLCGWIASPQILIAEEPAVITVENSNSGSVEVIRSIPYVQRGDKSLLADVYRPREGDGPFPVILMVHGGAWFSGNKVHVTLHARHAARRGYSVVAINYRLAPVHKFPAQLEDCQSALRWIGANSAKYHFDPQRVAAYGYSAGAHLVCLLGTTTNDREASETAGSPPIRAIVAGGTPCEFSWIPPKSKTLGYWLGGSREERADVYLAASPTEHVDGDDPPIFFFHGSRDRVVPVSSPQRMVAILRAEGVRSDLLVAQGESHISTFLKPNMRQQAIDFLDRELIVK